MMVQSEVLKACPWCAEMPNTDDGRNTDYGPRVWCANFPHCPVEPVAEGRTLADAITAWNTRTPAVATDEGVARLFHETYERLAPQFSYETRKASAVPWEQVPENNRNLMIAVAAEVRAAISTTKETHDGTE
jgi:hypothetical protein